MMEVEVDSTNDIYEDYIYEATDDIDDTAFENEKCGICMDIVIDRGVLDCCQHWFCFACIDNWATITSLCPLCQNEFQLITCVPVYDTIGSGKDEDELISRDDDWYIEGENNTLSFPSYYIDENSVICLDGDGCKIRSGLAITEENSSLDTSIACDSCDIWYHAFCVGFDPESTSESSWLCPRCVIDELPKIADGVSIECSSNPCGPETSSRECSVEAAFTRKVSVSVADAGETAVVVSSIVEGKKWREDSSNNILSVLETNEDGRAGTFLSYLSVDSSNLERIIAQPELDPQETSSALPISGNTPANQPCNSLPPGKLESNYVSGEICEPHHSDRCRISSDLLSGEKCIGSESSEHKPIIGLHPDLVSRSSLSAKKDRDASARQATGDVVLHSASEESPLPVDKVAPDADKRAVRFSGLKRKASRARNHAEVNEYSEHESKETRVKMEIQGTAKKARSNGKSQTNLLKRGVGKSITEGAKKLSPPPAASKDSQLRDIPEKEPAASDIMSIVRATNSRQSYSMQNPSKERDNGAGLRVKKIMRRAVEDKSSALVEDLRKEIREAVRNKATKDFSKSNLFDPKLLAAFRAAIGGSRTEPEPMKRLNPSIVRVKKAMLQKGKTRESLTKKIYGTANGKRRRAWDRDWEIEFWKHRCTKISNPEKVETLKSVLSLLRRNPESSEMEEESEDGAANPILARLYPADTSVFPRSDDVQPLSALTGGGNNEMKYGNSKEKVPKPPNDNHTVQTPMQTSKNSFAVDDANRNRNTPSLEVEAAMKKVHTTGTLKSGSKVQSQITKEVLGKSDVKTDKRKWALEVLARKTALVERDATQANQEDNAMLKGDYPLLAQLPMDMRPALAPSRHNKVAIPVRQALLYRLTEHLLKKADLPIMRRTAETELAIADAVNIEKDVADRSSSKLVYVNLCSQMLRQYVNNTKPCRVEESDPSSSAVCTDRTTDPSPQEPADPSVEEALKMAGLVSDSPPNSPYCIGKDLDNEHELSVRARDEGPENVFDMDSRPELDIYGDFEYDLEDEDLIGASAVKVSKSQPEEAELKMKVVFSTLNIEKTNNAQDSKGHESLGTIEKTVATPCLLEHNKEVGMRSLTLEVKIDTKCPPSEPLQGEIDGEPSLTECEELYGPDKEPLIEKISNQDSREPDKLTGIENFVCGENANHRSSKVPRAPEFDTESCAENIFVRGKFPDENNSSGGENSPTHSLTCENIRKKSKKTKIKPPDTRPSISRKVEAYIKEHIRPLCTSGVITTEQYRWAVGKTTDKVMRFHHKDKNANFLIKEGEKVKKLAEQYVEAAQQKKET